MSATSENDSMSEPSVRLTTGGNVKASSGTYLRRPADEELTQVCLEGEFAYVLACRQIGKSSLMHAVADRLVEKGIRVARIDLNRIGKTEDASSWYITLLRVLVGVLRLGVDVEAWWSLCPSRWTLTHRFLQFLNDVVLEDIPQRIVVFIDEIGMTLGLPFTDDFFEAIQIVL